MRIFISPYFKKRYQRLIKKNPQLRTLTDKKISLFEKNPLHHSLRLHKLSGKVIDQWSISLKGDLRIVFQYVKEGILLTDIGSHDEVY